MWNLPWLVAIKKQQYPSSNPQSASSLLLINSNLRDEFNQLVTENLYQGPSSELAKFIDRQSQFAIQLLSNAAWAKFPKLANSYLHSAQVIGFYLDTDLAYLDLIKESHDLFHLHIHPEQNLKLLHQPWPINDFALSQRNAIPSGRAQWFSFLNTIHLLRPPVEKKYHWIMFSREQVNTSDSLTSANSPLRHSIRNPKDNTTPMDNSLISPFFSAQLARDLHQREKFVLSPAQKPHYFHNLKALHRGSYMQGDLNGASDLCASIEALKQQRENIRLNYHGRFAFLSTSNQLSGFCYVYDDEIKELILGIIVKYLPNATTHHEALISLIIPSDWKAKSSVVDPDYLNVAYSETELNIILEQFVDNDAAYQRIRAVIKQPEMYLNAELGSSYPIDEINHTLRELAI